MVTMCIITNKFKQQTKKHETSFIIHFLHKEYTTKRNICLSKILLGDFNKTANCSLNKMTPSKFTSGSNIQHPF
jgi:hypothetical protein